VRFRVLASGSSGNATVIEAGETRVLLDAGLGPRILAERLREAGVEPASLSAIVLTHEHVDHIRGAAAFARRWDVRLAGSRGTRRAGGFLEALRELPGYDVLRPGEVHAIGGLELTPIAIPHDAAGPLAIVVRCAGAVLGVATDFGHFTAELMASLEACHALVIESNHDVAMLRDGPYPFDLKRRIAGPHGHVSNAETARFLGQRLGVSCVSVVLAHLSEINNHPEVARMETEPALKQAGREHVRLEIAGRNGGDWVEVAAVQSAQPAGLSEGQGRLF
jgi:phosphoribosyl 1,2-cyclic phosphodiesterase